MVIKLVNNSIDVYFIQIVFDDISTTSDESFPYQEALKKAQRRAQALKLYVMDRQGAILYCPFEASYYDR